MRIRAVVAGGPAAAAGLRVGDVVLTADGRPIALPDELVVAIRTKQPGDVMRLVYLRGGKRAVADVVLGSTKG